MKQRNTVCIQLISTPFTSQANLYFFNLYHGQDSGLSHEIGCIKYLG